MSRSDRNRIENRWQRRIERLEDRCVPAVLDMVAVGAETGELPIVKLIDPNTGVEQLRI